MIAGNRRIGKTTVCNAACARLHEAEFVIVRIEVPERSTQDLCQFIIERCDTQSRTKTLRKAAGALTPLVEKLLEDAGLPLNLDALEGGPTPAQQRTILSLPIHLAAGLGKPVVFFLDQLQRVVD
jgi:hypothetical protein